MEHVFHSPKELLKLSIPSVVYAVQNNMAFLALSNLDAAVYQVRTTTYLVTAVGTLGLKTTDWPEYIISSFGVNP